MKSKPVVAVTRRLPPAVEARMSELFEARLRTDDTPLNQAQLKALIAECDVFVPTVTDQITADVLSAADPNRLRLIANFGAGTNHIDVATAHGLGIPVSNTPGVLTEDTADLAMAGRGAWHHRHGSDWASARPSRIRIWSEGPLS